MKRYIALVAALGLASGLYAQDFGQVNDLYRAGMYSETLRLVQGNNSPMAEGYRALCALKLKTAHSHDIAKAFIARYHENLLVPQVRYQLGLDYFDQERYEEALQQFNQVSVKDIQEYMQRLSELQAGTTIPVKVLRGEETLILQVSLNPAE